MGSFDGPVPRWTSAGAVRLVAAIFAAMFPFFVLASAAHAQEGSAGPRGAKITLGEEEPVLVGNDEGERVEVLAKVDTGAGYSSIDDDIARDLGIDIEDPPDTVTIQSSLGEEERPLVPADLKVAGRTLSTRVTVTDREDLTSDMLLGSNDLSGFTMVVGEEQLTTPEGPTVGSPVAALLEFPPPPPAVKRQA